MRENIRSFVKKYDELHSFASELSHAADGIVLSEAWFSANTCHDAQGYTGFHIYRTNKTGGGVSVLIRNCHSSTHMANFSVCHACYEIYTMHVALRGYCQGLLQLQAWVWVGFYKRAADFYE